MKAILVLMCFLLSASKRVWVLASGSIVVLLDCAGVLVKKPVTSVEPASIGLAQRVLPWWRVFAGYEERSEPVL